MENRYKINYDIKLKNVVNVTFKQGDIDSSVLDLTLLDNGQVIDISGETIEFRFLKSDDTVVFQDSSAGVNIIDSVNGNVECVLKSNTIASVGDVICEIHRTKDGKTLTTQSFNFTVEQSISGDGVLSTNYIGTIDGKLIEIEASEAIRVANETDRVALYNEINMKLTNGELKGDKGDTGAQGIQGTQGIKGDTGAVPDISVGTVTTLAAGSNATVTRRVDSPDTAPIFDFSIPKGADGTGAGDVTKADYDSNADGVVNDSDKLGGQLPSYYAKSSDVGDKTTLKTTDKSTVVAAINENSDEIGNLSTSYLVSFNGNGNVYGEMSNHYGIGLAATRDKKTYVVQEDMVFGPTLKNGDFDRDIVKDPCLLRVEDKLFMYYSGYTTETTPRYKIGLATLDLTKNSVGDKKSNWIRHPDFPLDFGIGSYNIFAKVLYEPNDVGQEFKMWFASGNGFTGMEIYYAYSSDGIAWTLHGKVLSLGVTGDWDDNFINPTGIKKIDTTYYLLYAGYKVGERQKTGFATFTDPKGVYTKSPLNPLLTKKNQNQLLTADANIGDKILKVANTSAFSAGMTILIADDRSATGTEYNQIHSIVNATDIELVQPLIKEFLTASNAAIFGLENGANNISTFDYKDGVYTAYGTAFQLGEIGTTIGNYLIETTFIAQGTTLGNLQFVHERSPFLGMYRGTSFKWDYKSRENPNFLELGSDIKAHDLLEFYPDPVLNPISKTAIIPLRASAFGATGLSVTSSTFANQGYRVFPGTSKYPANAVFTLVTMLGVSNVATTAEHRLASDGATTVYGTATSNVLGRNIVRKVLTNLPTTETIIQEDFRSTDNTNNAVLYSSYIEVSW